MTFREPSSVAVVHDYLNQCGGAERVALELARIWPGTPLYTSLYRQDSTFPEAAEEDIRVSALDRFPFDKRFRALAPLYPLAFRSLGTLEQEVVISSSSGWAHSVRTSPSSLHVVYCHNPARWLYRPDDYLGHTFGRAMLAPFGRRLRAWDQQAAQRADIYIATCEHVRNRIRSIYGRDAQIVHPPVDTSRFTPAPSGERLLVVARLLPYKRVDLVVRAASRAGLALDVVGTGPSLDELQRMAGPTVAFHGQVDDLTLEEMFQNCRALCVAATEDFGLSPIEANAAGKLVIAYGAGGALETIEDGVTGVLFDELTEKSLLAALARAEDLDHDPYRLARHASQFSNRHFHHQVREIVATALEQKSGRPMAAAA